MWLFIPECINRSFLIICTQVSITYNINPICIFTCRVTFYGTHDCQCFYCILVLECKYHVFHLSDIILKGEKLLFAVIVCRCFVFESFNSVNHTFGDKQYDFSLIPTGFCSRFSSYSLWLHFNLCSAFLPSTLLYRFEHIFLCMPGLLCLPLISVSVQINRQAPETCLICVIHHIEQRPFLQLHYRFALLTPQMNLCTTCVIMQTCSGKWLYNSDWLIDFHTV